MAEGADALLSIVFPDTEVGLSKALDRMAFFVDYRTAQQDFVDVFMEGVNSVLALLNLARFGGDIRRVRARRFGNRLGIGRRNRIAIDRQIRLDFWTTWIILNRRSGLTRGRARLWRRGRRSRLRSGRYRHTA